MSRQLNAAETAYYQSCLQRAVSLAEIATRKMGRPPPDDTHWQQFLAQMNDADELWQYSSPPEDWQNLMGESSIAIVRNGAVIDVFTLLHN